MYIYYTLIRLQSMEVSHCRLNYSQFGVLEHSCLPLRARTDLRTSPGIELTRLMLSSSRSLMAPSLPNFVTIMTATMRKSTNSWTRWGTTSVCALSRISSPSLVLRGAPTLERQQKRYLRYLTDMFPFARRSISTLEARSIGTSMYVYLFGLIILTDWI